MQTSRLFKGLGTAGLSVAATAALLHFGGVLPDPDPGPGLERADEVPPAVREFFPPGAELATFPDIVRRAGLESELEDAVDRWSRSWAGVGSEARRTVYDEVGSTLVDHLSPDAVPEQLWAVRQTVEEARLYDPVFLPHTVVRGVERADSLEIVGQGLLEDGDTVEALVAGLLATDALRTVGSRAVAEQLTERAEEALRRIHDGSPYSEREARRGERLAVGAREAFESGEYSRAIERAYYACQLLEVDHTGTGEALSGED